MMKIILEKDEYIALRPNPYKDNFIAEIEELITYVKSRNLEENPLVKDIETLLEQYKENTAKLEEDVLW